MTSHNYRIMRMILLLLIGVLTLLAGAVSEDDDDFSAWYYEEDGLIITSIAYTETYRMTTEIYRSDDFELHVMFPGPSSENYRFYGIPNGTLYVDVTYEDQLLYSDRFELQQSQAGFFRYTSKDASVEPKQTDFGYNVPLRNFSIPDDARYIVTNAVIRTEGSQAFASSDIFITGKVPESVWVFVHVTV